MVDQWPMAPTAAVVAAYEICELVANAQIGEFPLALAILHASCPESL